MAEDTITVRGLPAGRRIWARVRSTAPGRVSSDWSSPVFHDTTALTPPSGVTEDDLQGDQVLIRWSIGEANFDVMIELVLTSGGAQVAAPVRLPAGATRHRFTGLELSTDYTARVSHVDDYGGASTKATDEFTTTGTATVLPRPLGILVLVGEVP